MRAALESDCTNPNVALFRAVRTHLHWISVCSEISSASSTSMPLVLDCAFNLAMAEQQLHRPEVLRAFVNQDYLRTAHRMRAARRRIKPRGIRPSMYHPRIMPG
jgi:hypothetical protein